MILRYFMLFVLLIFVQFPVQAAINSGITVYIQQRGNSLLQEQFASENIVYEIKKTIDLSGATITIPKGCTLKFIGGRFVNGEIIGQNTKIETRIKQIFDCNLKLSGTWDVSEVYPEWFGAVGNGNNDDTESIRKAMLFATGKTLMFSNKTYIVNVIPGKDNETQRIVFSSCKCAELKGDGAIIQLGNNDNCNLYANKGFVALFSVYTIDTFAVKGITFDFNYAQNPIWQTQGIRQGIQENTQQNAFQFRRVRKVLIEDCKFIGHSGTNCIDYNDARYNEGDKTFEVTIRNCKFLKCGGKSFYMDDATKRDAYHDCSTIAIHYCGSNHETQYIVNVCNNFFEGIGGNAYNVIETDAKELNFIGNTILKYSSGIFPCANIYDANITIKDNRFLKMCRAVLLWLQGGTDADSNRYGYRKLNIKNNKCIIDIGYWKNLQRYDNVGAIEGNRYGFLFTTSENNKSVKVMSILDNTIKYVGVKKLLPRLATKATINFESAGKNVKMMKCDTITISRNKIFNAPNRVLHNSLFQSIKTIVFDDNYFFKPFSVIKATSENSGGIIYLNHLKSYTPSLDRPTIMNFFARNNNVVYYGYKPDDGCAAILNCKMELVNSSNNKLIVKGNRCKSTPQYGMVYFKSVR